MKRSSLAWLLVLAACTGPGTGVEPLVREVEEGPVEEVLDHETFDIARFVEEPPAPLPDPQHDVPEALLSGRAQDPMVPRTRSGFRIEIASTTEKEAADQLAAQAASWWRALLGRGVLDEVYPQEAVPPPVYQEFRSPYYRVRLGNFMTRAEAEAMLDIVESRFADAFIAPADVLESRRP